MTATIWLIFSGIIMLMVVVIMIGLWKYPTQAGGFMIILGYAMITKMASPILISGNESIFIPGIISAIIGCIGAITGAMLVIKPILNLHPLAQKHGAKEN